MDVGRQYRVGKVVGRGGFGCVYRAELLGAEGFTKPVALKILHADMENIEEVSQRLRDEARMLGRLRHRAIVGVDGLIQLDDRWTVIMEYIHGIDLQRAVKATPLPSTVALRVTGEVASALHSAYHCPDARGEPLYLQHRDIKPSNILLTAGGDVKVVDFGIAKAELASREAQTRSMLFGSELYMAPERLDLMDGPEGDVYSLGVTLFELVVGEAFGRTSPKPSRHRERLGKAVDRLRCAVPAEAASALVPLIARMVAYEPEDRPTARELEREVAQLGRRLEGPLLRDWAEAIVPSLMQARLETPDAGELSGTILVERSTGSKAPVERGSVGEPLADDFDRGGDTLAYSSPQPTAIRVDPTRTLPPRAPRRSAEDTGRKAVGAVVAGGLFGGLGLVLLVLVALVGGVWYVARGVDEAPVVSVDAQAPAQPEAAETPAAEVLAEEAPAPVAAVAEKSARSPVRSRSVAVPEGTVKITGDATEVRLLTGSKVEGPGRVPVGNYTIQARFTDGEWIVAGNLEVGAGETHTLNCQALFTRCDLQR